MHCVWVFVLFFFSSADVPLYLVRLCPFFSLVLTVPLYLVRQNLVSSFLLSNDTSLSCTGVGIAHGVHFLCWLLFVVRLTLVLPQWHIKGCSHSAKSVRGRLHLSTHELLTQRSRIGLFGLDRASVETHQGNKLTRDSSGNACLHSRISSLSHSILILALRVKLVRVNWSPL